MCIFCTFLYKIGVRETMFIMYYCRDVAKIKWLCLQEDFLNHKAVFRLLFEHRLIEKLQISTLVNVT